MDTNALQERSDSAKSKFDALLAQKSQKEKEIEEIDAELYRLQGEFRIVAELLEKPAEPTKISPTADVIDADAALETKEEEK